MTALVNSLQSFELCSNAVSLWTECGLGVRAQREKMVVRADGTGTVTQPCGKPAFLAEKRR